MSWIIVFFKKKQNNSLLPTNPTNGKRTYDYSDVVNYK